MCSGTDAAGFKSADVLAVVDADLMVTSWTGAAERLWGYSADEVLRRPVAPLLAPDGSLAAGVFTDRGSWRGSLRISLRSGRQETVALSVRALHGGEGAAGWLVCAPDPLARPGLDMAALQALVGHAPVSLVLWDRDMRCTWFNDCVDSGEIFRSGPELGGQVADLFDAQNPDLLESAMAQVLEGDVPMLRHELRPATGTGRESDYSWVAFLRLEAVGGRPLGVCSLAVRVRAGQDLGRLQLLGVAAKAVGTQLDLMNDAQEFAQTAVPSLADYATIDVVEDILLGREPLNHLEATDAGVPSFYRAGAAFTDPGLRGTRWDRGNPVFVPPKSPGAPESPLNAVLESGRSHFEPVVDSSPGSWIDNDPERARNMRRIGMHSVMVVPLQARGSLLGAAVFARTRNPKPFTRGDLVLAEGLAARASLSLDNALRYTRERKTSLALQRDLLPRRLSGGSTVEVAHRYLPSDAHAGVGGDWVDVFPCPQGGVALVAGDVVGHGINAAATMGRLRTMVRTLTKLNMRPDDLLSHVDELALELGPDPLDREALVPPVVVATCLYALYDPAARRCTFASAGHPPPAVLAPDGSVSFVKVRPGPPLGVGVGSFESSEVELPEGSVLALYTDGLIETRDYDIDHGLERLRTALARPAANLDDLCAAVVDTMVPGGPAEDDIALLLARILSETT